MNYFNQKIMKQQCFVPTHGNDSTAIFFTKTKKFPFTQPLIDNSRGATDTRVDLDCSNRAVFCTSAAFHACVEVADSSTFPRERKNLMRTNLLTPATTGACCLVQVQGSHISQIAVTFHGTPLYCHSSRPDSSRRMLMKSEPAITGMAKRISFFTPEREVKVVHPVKLSI